MLKWLVLHTLLMPILAMRVRVHRNPVTRVTDLLERLKAPENCQRMFGFWNMLEHVGTCWNIVRYLEQGLIILMSDAFGPWKLHDAAFAYQRHFQPRRISL